MHDIHNDYPLVAEKINIPKEWLSNYSLNIANAHNITTGTVKKIVPNLMSENNYVIHYKNLHLETCLELGMKLNKIHRVLKFKQKVWKKPYIDFNTQKRKEATNEADKNYFKLSNNAVYGKTMENMRKRIKIRNVKNAKVFIRYTSRPTYVNWKAFENNLAAIHEKKISLTLNELIYVRFTMLEISKWELYNFHYNFMIRKFNTRLLFTDTDSLCYELYEKKRPYKKMYKYKEVFDLSNFPVSSKYYCSDNKKVLGKMKDEYDGKPNLKFVGQKSKMYSILHESNNEKIISKGRNGFIEFYNTLFKKNILRHTMRRIGLKIIILVPMKLIKDLYHVLMINDIFSKMELIH